jgi:hypothetical protein
MSKETLILTNIRFQYFPNRVEVKVKGLGWVDILNPNLKNFVILSNISNSKFLSVTRLAERKGIFTADKLRGSIIIQGG